MQTIEDIVGSSHAVQETGFMNGRPPTPRALDARFVYITYCDIHGLPRGKLVSRDYYDSLGEGAMRNCCGVFSKDVTGTPVEATGILWENGADDNFVRPCPETLRVAPWQESSAMVIADVFEPDGTPLALSPRAALKRAIDHLRALTGAEAVAGYELEFSLLDKEGRFLSQGTHSYSVQQMTGAAHVLDRIAMALDRSGIAINGISAENGDGQYEVSLRHAGALEMADALFQTKHLIKEVAHRAGCRASFMAVPRTGLPPNGLHLNVSLSPCGGFGFCSDRTPNAVLADSLAGILGGAADLLLLFLPTVNSFRAPYSRSFFPKQVSWGFDNRSALVRIPDTQRPACRFEFRLPTADANPYLAMAGILALMARGHETSAGASLPPPVSGNGFARADLPEMNFDFDRAIDRLAGQKWLQAILGEKLLETYAAVKRSEVSNFRTWVSDWEKEVYGKFF